MISRRKIVASLLASAVTSPHLFTRSAFAAKTGDVRAGDVRAGDQENSSALSKQINLPKVGVHLPLWHQGELDPDIFWTAVFEELQSHSISQCSILCYYFVDPRTGEISNKSKFNNLISPDIGFLEHALKIAERNHVRPSLYPMLEIDNPHQIGDIWRGNLNFFGTTLTSFFAQYSKLIMSHCKLAQKYDTPYLYVGSELSSLTHNIAARPFWEQMFYELKSKGHQGNTRLIYAAHWEEYLTFPFWRQMDEIGINAYFPLAELSEAVGTGKPSVKITEERLMKKFAELETFARRHKRPCQISEFGLTGFDGTTAKPWLQSPSETADPYELESGYHALFKAMKGAGVSAGEQSTPWLTSASLWHWKVPERNGSAYNIEPHSPVANMIRHYNQL